MIDVVYVLGNGSPWNNNELRYSLRSLERFAIGYRNVYIIGECPDFIKNVIHIPYVDEHPEKETRIALKVLRAFAEDSISEHILFMNDDIFIMEEFNVSMLPFYHKGLLAEEMNSPILNHVYKQTLLNTYSELKKNNHSVYNFDIHTPVIYTKPVFQSIFRKYDWNIKYSYGVKSIYCNTFGITGDYLPDCKILKRVDYHTLCAMTNNVKFFSISDSAIGGPLEALLSDYFPCKSKYEK